MISKAENVRHHSRTADMWACRSSAIKYLDRCEPRECNRTTIENSRRATWFIWLTMSARAMREPPWNMSRRYTRAQRAQYGDNLVESLSTAPAPMRYFRVEMRLHVASETRPLHIISGTSLYLCHSRLHAPRTTLLIYRRITAHAV